LYWDGRTEDIESVQTVCDAITPPTFIEPEPVLMERLVECSWTNPYTQEVVQGTAIQKYNTFWDGTTADVDSVETVCSNAAPIFIEPEPVLQERIVDCVWLHPYTGDYVYGTAVSQYNVYWDNSEVYVVSPEVACATAEPVFPPTYECWDGNIVYDASQCAVKPVDPQPTPTPSEEPKPSPTPSPTPTEEPEPVVPPVTPEEPSAVEELLDSLEEGEAVSTEQLAELGIDYSELPPETLVELENGVVITAEIADAIEIFEDPSELLMTVFTDPSKAVKALLNVGADLTPEKRKEVAQAAVPAIIVTQIAASTAAALATRRF
jgi:hypothetical protein